MTKYEKLAMEYDQLDISERKMKCKGLYGDDCIWIKKDLPTDEKVCILAEEIGHYETTVGDILDQTNISSMRQEYIARKWAYKKLVPYDDIIKAFKKGYRTTYEVAEHLGVCEEFLRDCIAYYDISAETQKIKKELTEEEIINNIYFCLSQGTEKIAQRDLEAAVRIIRAEMKK